MEQRRIEFAITTFSFLDEDGALGQPLPDGYGEGWLVDAYRAMVLARTFDQRAIALQRTGQLGTYASVLGQEAVGVAIGLAMRPEDVLVPYYRDVAAQHARGVTFRELLAYWGGDERGSAYAAETARQDLPICVPVATQATHAAGVATAFRIRDEPRVAVTTAGDGATSKGDFLEALNLAGAWRLPVVFVVNNNQWAISVPRRAQSGAQTLAQKAIGAGVAGVRIDGNDVAALRVALDAAVARARARRGATLIEAETYRLSDHTTADDASRYRPKGELDAAWRREPVRRLRTYLAGRGLWDEGRERALVEACEAEIAAAVEAYLAAPPQPPEDLFDYHYARLPASLRGQRRHAVERARRGDGEGGGDA